MKAPDDNQWLPAASAGGQTHCRSAGNRIAVVMLVATSTASYWGFVIYDEGLAVGGACDPTWTLGDAMRAADEELGTGPVQLSQSGEHPAELPDGAAVGELRWHRREP